MADKENLEGNNDTNNKKEGSRLRTVKNVLVGIIVFITFAYGFQVTEINLEEPKEENRQKQLTNVIRALARPDLLAFDIDRIEVNAAILVPCPETQFTLPDLSQPGPSIELSEACAEPGSEVTVSGSGFEKGDDVLIFFVPFKEDVSEEVQLPLADERVRVDDEGNFSTVVVLRKDRTSAEPQKIRAVVNRSVPHRHHPGRDHIGAGEFPGSQKSYDQCDNGLWQLDDHRRCGSDRLVRGLVAVRNHWRLGGRSADRR
jgi:hypothetical protein